MQKLHPENQWSWNEILLNDVEYALRVLIWQNSADGHDKHPKHYPKPWLPSFMPKPEKPKKKTEEAAMDISELKEYLSRPRISAKVEANE